MKVEIIYPERKKNKRIREKVENIIKWSFIGAAYICPVINICVGGKAWSIVVLWSLRFAWSVIFSRDLIEYNRISQTVKILLFTCMLLILIELCLASGWAGSVVPLVCCGTLVLIGILFFSNLSRQKQNIMPMMWMIAASFLCIVAFLMGWTGKKWPIIVLGSIILALPIVSILVLKKDLILELKKRFHV